VRASAPAGAAAAALLATYAVSGLQHEVIMLYCNHAVACTMLAFFTLHGVMVLAEAYIERALLGADSFARHRQLLSTSALYRWTRRALVFAAVTASAELLWWPPFLQHGLEQRLIAEWASWLRPLQAVAAMVQGSTSA
jgi:hypothetical protein